MPLPIEVLAEVRENIKTAEQALTGLTAEINKARTAGLDVTEQQKEMEELKKQIRQLKAVYGGR